MCVNDVNDVNDVNAGDVVVVHELTHKTNQSQILPVAIAPAQAATIPSSLPIGQSDSLVIETAKNVSESAKPVLNKTAIPPSHPASPTDMEELIIGAVKNNPPKIKELETYLASAGSLDESLKPLLTELLLYSIEKEQWDCARVLVTIDLIKNDADIMKVIEKLKEPITRAVENNNANALKTCLNFYSSLNFCGNLDRKFKSLLTKQLLYLIENLENENLECACILIKNGAQVTLTVSVVVEIGTDNEDEYPAAELGKKLFMVALGQEHKEIIQMLMGKLIHSGYTSEPFLGGHSVLSLAVRDKKRDSVEIIIQAFYEAGLNPNDYINIPNTAGETPLMLAVRNEDEDVIRLLLRIKETDETIFTSIVKNSKTDSLEMLIQAFKKAGMGLDGLTIPNKNGETPLMLVARNGDKRLIELMIKEADSTFLERMLLEAVKHGNEAMIKLLLKRAEANPTLLNKFLNECDEEGNTIILNTANTDFNGFTLSNKNGETPLMLAAKDGDKESIELIIKGIDNSSGFLNMLLSKCDVNGDNVFALAAKNGGENIIEVLIQALIEADENPNSYLNVKNKQGHTPLMLAAMGGHEKTVRLLLTKAGVDRNARDEYYKTALMWAADCGQWGILRMLSENGANFSDIHVLLAWQTEQHTFEIKKNALTNKAQELIANGASLETARKINKIKKWAHVWGLTETYTTKDEMDRNVVFKLGGFSKRECMFQTLINYVNKFYESTQHNQHNLTLLKENQVVVQTSIEHALFESSSSSDIDSAIKSSPLLVLLCEWGGHAFSMVVDHSKKQPELMICNRGEGARPDGFGNAIVERYAFNDASHINETTIKKLTKIHNNIKEFNDMISDMISRKILEKVPNNNFIQSLQKAENCTWANTKGALPLMLRIITSKNTGELVRTVVERKDYKEFSAWVRAEALEELLLSNPPRDLVLKFLEKYITKLFGQNIPYGEGGITRPVKEIIEEIQSPDKTSEMRINGINNLISLLGIENMQTEQAKRQGMQKIRALFETWLKGLRDDILSEATQEKRS